MGVTGSDVTKEAADIVLTDDNFASIVAAIEQGRVIYGNIRRFVSYLLGSNLAEIVVIFAAILLGYPSPLTPLQILWVNLLSDGAPALALGVEKGEPDAMKRPPRSSDEPIINGVVRLNMAVQIVAIASVTLSAYFLFGRQGDVAAARNAAFVTLSASQILLAYAYRSERFLLFQIGLWGNRSLQGATLLSLALLMSVIYLPFLQSPFSTRPLSLADWSIIAPLALVPFAAAELVKALRHLSTKRATRATREISR